MDGTGSVEVSDDHGTKTLRYGPWDIFVLPSWKFAVMRPETESVIFCASDQAAQTKLGLWREERGG